MRVPRFQARWLLPLLWILAFDQAWSKAEDLLAQPNQTPAASRIIALTPHLTELVYSAGAGDKLVAAASHSDYPPEALSLPKIGGYHALNLEQIVSLKPDLILAWEDANRVQDLGRLRALGLPVLVTRTAQLEDIPAVIRQIGTLAGTADIANARADRLTHTLRTLRARYAERSKVSVFYQIWQEPLMTVNGRQFIGQALTLCGARNVFDDLPMLAAEVSLESVLIKNPQVILLGGTPATQLDWLTLWQRWPSLQAVQNHQIYPLDTDTFQRPTARFIDGLQGLCDLLQKTRNVRDLQE
jgi:iron complex transport system substrate-binding protein